MVEIFMGLIALFVGWVLPITLHHLNWPAPRERGPVALMIVGIAGVVFFIASGDRVTTEVLTGLAFVALLARLLWEFGLKHRKCSQAVEVILALPTYGERVALLRSLPDDVQQMVRKRTPRSDLQNPAFNPSEQSGTPVLLANCANVGLDPINMFLPSVYGPLEGVDRTA